MANEFLRAAAEDIDELLLLYRQVYGRDYALPLGTDPEVMGREIASPSSTWLVARDDRGRLVGSILGTVDQVARVGKLQGLVIHPEARGGGLANLAVRQLSDAMLADSQETDSVYATARTNATAPQRTCLRAGFHALGIFPNLRKAAKHETMVLLARHRPGVLDKRIPVERVPQALGGLIEALRRTLGPHQLPEISDEPLPLSGTARRGARSELEMIDAPSFVARRYARQLADPEDGFYPFHTPNVLLSRVDGSAEVYAQLSPSDGYCTLIGASPGLAEADLEAITERLAAGGAGYIETLLPLDAYHELSRLLAAGFLPVAAYPAMRREEAGYRDYVVMARTLQPLDFRGLAIDAAFQPFTEQYIELWTNQHLNTYGIFQ
ncbi:GNAT family N-acetyltransferase [Kitasatospora sp. NPDC052896]|uniref:GNAT family N-acetyltransferase n=1 Tax=Kitasatospora sp. NPDC052896 TaxID=3364061 RepID=UPI0037C7EA64